MRTDGPSLKILGGGNCDSPLKALCYFFNSINFGCGVQAFKKLKLIDEERLEGDLPTKNKLLIYNLEWTIANVFEQGLATSDTNKYTIKKYVDHFTEVYKSLFNNEQPKHIAACVMDKIYIYFKEDEKGYVETLKQFIPILNPSRVVEVFKKFQEKSRNFGTFKLLDAYIKSLENQ